MIGWCMRFKMNSTAVKMNSTAVKMNSTAVKMNSTAVKMISTAVKMISTAVKMISTAVKMISTAVYYRNYEPNSAPYSSLVIVRRLYVVIRGSLVIERRLCVELSSFTNTYWPCLGLMLWFALKCEELRKCHVQITNKAHREGYGI